MAKKCVAKFFRVNNGIKAGRFIGDCDPRCYRPPIGYLAHAELVEYHPVTDHYLDNGQWWIFLTPSTINTIMTDVYLSKLSNDEALKKLMKLNAETLAETLLDCFHRGGCRFLFCNADGEPF